MGGDVFLVMVVIDGETLQCDGIEWMGKLWLVPQWVQTTTKD